MKRSYSISPELIHYQKGQRAKKHKYIAIKNGRYIYQDNVYNSAKKAYKQVASSAKDLYRSGLGLKNKAAKKVGTVKETILKETVVPETIQKEKILKEKVIQDKADRKPYNWDAYNTREASRKKRYTQEAKAAKAKAERLAKQQAAGAQRRRTNIGGDLSLTNYIRDNKDQIMKVALDTAARDYGLDISDPAVRRDLEKGVVEGLHERYIIERNEQRKFDAEHNRTTKKIKDSKKKLDSSYNDATKKVQSNKAYKKMQKKANKKKQSNRR